MQLFMDILKNVLLHLISAKFPQGHKLMQENDAKHTSGLHRPNRESMGRAEEI